MSVKVMTAVFDRYPNGGGEMLLALALADHASDDGSRVFPSIKALAEKTRQSERSVQYQLRRMQDAGWLILVNAGNGGRSMHSEYRISLDWIKGAEIAPFQKGAIDDEKGANDSTKGCNPQQKRVQPIAPANNHHRTINEPSVTKAQALGLDGMSDELLNDWQTVRTAKRAGPLTKTAADGLKREAAKAGLTNSEAIELCCANGWQGFRAAWVMADRMAMTAKAGAAGGAETAYQRSMRERMQEAVPSIARKVPGEATQPARAFFDAQVVEVTTKQIGGAA